MAREKALARTTTNALTATVTSIAIKIGSKGIHVILCFEANSIKVAYSDGQAFLAQFLLVCGLKDDVKSLCKVHGKCLTISELTGGKHGIYWASENSPVKIHQTGNLDSKILGKRTDRNKQEIGSQEAIRKKRSQEEKKLGEDQEKNRIRIAKDLSEAKRKMEEQQLKLSLGQAAREKKEFLNAKQ